MVRLKTNRKQLKALLSSVGDNAHRLFDNISEENFYRKPGPNKWCAGECLDHLNITTALYLAEIEKSVLSAKTNYPVEPDYQPRYLVDKFIKITGPNSKVKLKSPVMLKRKNNPGFNLPKGVVIDEFFSIQKKLLEMLKQSENLDLSKTVINWPVFKLIKLQLGEAFLLNGVHALRHLQQAERAINS